MAKKEGNGKGKTGKKGAALIERLTLTFHRPLFTLSDYEAYHDTDLLRPYPTSRPSPPISYNLTFSPLFAVVVRRNPFFLLYSRMRRTRSRTGLGRAFRRIPWLTRMTRCRSIPTQGE